MHIRHLASNLKQVMLHACTHKATLTEVGVVVVAGVSIVALVLVFVLEIALSPSTRSIYMHFCHMYIDAHAHTFHNAVLGLERDGKA